MDYIDTEAVILAKLKRVRRWRSVVMAHGSLQSSKGHGNLTGTEVETCQQSACGYYFGEDDSGVKRDTHHRLPVRLKNEGS